MNHGKGYQQARPFPMAQSQEVRQGLRGRNNMRGNRTYPRPLNSIDPNYYPPGTPRNPEYQTQPALEGPEFFAQGQIAAGERGPTDMDVVSGSNNQNFFTIGLPYTYKLDQANLGFIELPPNGIGSFTVSISADADFVIFEIQGQCTRNCIFSINDAGSGRMLQNRPVTAFELLGTGQRNNQLSVPMLIKAKSALQVDIVDMGDLSFNIYNGTLVADAALQPSVINPPALVNRISIAFVGIKRVEKG